MTQIYKKKTLRCFFQFPPPLVRRIIIIILYLCGNSAPDTTLATDLASDKSDGQVGADVDLHLDLAVLLNVAHGGLGERLAGLEDLLAQLLGLVVAVVVAVLGVAVGLGDRDLDLARTLGEAQEDVAAGGDGDLRCAARGDRGVGGDDGGEAAVCLLEADGRGGVGSDGDDGLDARLDVCLLELGDERGLDGCAAGGELGRVDGRGAGGGRGDGCGLG